MFGEIASMSIIGFPLVNIFGILAFAALLAAGFAGARRMPLALHQRLSYAAFALALIHVSMALVVRL